MASSGSAARLARIPLERIEADTAQPREDFPRPELEALSESIEALGLVHPLVVETLGEHRYRLIAGERRLRALRIGHERGRHHEHFLTPPALVLSEPVTDPTRRLLQLAENLARRDLRPVEVARGMQAARQALELERLLEAMNQASVEVPRSEPEKLREVVPDLLEQAGVPVPRVTWDEVLARVGMRMDAARRKAYLRLLRLPDDVLDEMERAGLSAHAAEAVSRLGDIEAQRELLLTAADRGAPRAVAQAAAAMSTDPQLPAREAVEGALRAHREADAARARNARSKLESGAREDVVRDFARAAKALIRELDTTTPTTFQAGTIRMLCDEVMSALAQV